MVTKISLPFLLWICFQANAQFLPFANWQKPAAGGGGCTSGAQTFSYTGADQTFTVPAGCTNITIRAWGAGGGGPGAAGPGGAGGYTTATLAVNGGDTLTIMVGQGGPMTGNTYGGGGSSPLAYSRGSGGGRSAIRSGGNDLLTAGGGGGGGYYGGGAGDAEAAAQAIAAAPAFQPAQQQLDQEQHPQILVMQTTARELVLATAAAFLAATVWFIFPTKKCNLVNFSSTF